ncbi:MAG: hypothetical protein RIB71_07540 [Imperialibacter sp.]|uniref:hypothetical protein n=1 Tax=Imperialibacter sp. TaxID=2038411 RepID=UPI0032EDF7A9
MQTIGKFCWVLDDFTYTGSYYPKADNNLHAVAPVEIFIADENMIRMVTKPIAFDGEEIGYTINLTRDTDKKYAGSFHLSDYPDSKGKMDAELFENQYKYFLFGKWYEEGEDGLLLFTWFATIDKLAKPA